MRACLFSTFVTIWVAHIFTTQSLENTSVITNWTSIPLNDLNLQRRNAIYSKTLSDDGIGLWIFGGLLEDNSISSSVMYLNLETDDITSYDDFMGRSSSILPTAIYCNHQCSTTVNNDQIAIVSPQTSNVSVIYELWLFDSTQMTLTNISLDIDIQDACVTSSMAGSLVYLLGGAQKGGDVLDTARIYDTNTKQWVRINNTMNIARSSASCQFHNDRLYIFGGTTFDSDLGTRTKTKSIEVYDMDSGQWTLLDDTLSVIMNDAQALLADPIIFIMGGHGESWTSYTMDAFVIHDTDDSDNLYDSYALPDTNTTHSYGIFMVDDIRQRLIAVSGQEWDDQAGEITTNMFLEYSNKMDNVAFLEQNEPTSAPIMDDIYDQIEDEIANILDKNEFLDPNTWGTLTKFVVIIASILAFISCCAFCQHKCRCNCCGCRGADDVEWWRLFRYSLQVYDLFTDINFSASLWIFWQMIDSHDWSDEHITEQKTYYFYAAVLSCVFLIVPYLSNLFFVLCPCGLPSLLSQPSYAEAKMWMIARAKLFSVLVMLSGGAYASLTLVNSKMFGVAAFTMGLSRRQLLQFTDIQVKLSIMLENIPQCCLQLSVIFNRYLHPDLYHGVVMDMVTGMSLISSVFLIVIGIVSTCIIKTQHIDDLEITIDVTSIEHNKKVIKKIHHCLGLRASIARELSLVFGCDENVIEVPRINRTMYGCKIRLFIAKSDTIKTLTDLNCKVQDISKVLSLLFRVDEKGINIFMMATSSDMVNNVAIAQSRTGLKLSMDQMRQLSNNTDYCNPRLNDDDDLSSNDDEKDPMI
eukprot:70483_1